MVRKVLSATFAVMFIASLFFFVYNQVNAAVTCNASASANSVYASGSVSPGITNLKWEHKKDDTYSGTATVRAACGGDVEKKEGAAIRIRVKERTTTSNSVYTSTSTTELYTIRESVRVTNWDWPSVAKIGYATGSISGASDTDRAEYHSSGYYN